MQNFKKIDTFFVGITYTKNGDTMEDKIILGLVLFFLLFAFLKLHSHSIK